MYIHVLFPNLFLYGGKKKGMDAICKVAIGIQKAQRQRGTKAPQSKYKARGQWGKWQDIDIRRRDTII